MWPILRLCFYAYKENEKHGAFCYIKKNIIIYIVTIETVIISGNRQTDRLQYTD